MSDRAMPPLVLHEARLDNGLALVVHEDRSAPIVAVNLWYRVGSKHERPGRTGFAHLFEHLLFQGSEHVDRDQHFGLIQQRGGTANGATWFDRTNYYETLPGRDLELALWLESDRLGWFLPAITQEKLDNQRDVVKNERRWRVDNQPYGTWLERGFELLFPPGHPYHWPVIGYMPDLDAASLDDVREFFRTWYHPGNAVLSIVGDVDPRRAEELVRRWFEAIPRGPEPPAFDSRLVAPARERRLVVEDAVALPKLFYLWAIPPFGTPGYYALDLLSDLLSSGRSSRLYRILVHERELAKEVSAFTFNTEEAGAFFVVATPRPGVGLDALEDAIDRELERVRREPPTGAEMTRTLNRIETAFVGRLESVETRADLLSMYATCFGDPQRASSEIERYRAVDAEAVQRIAAAELVPQRRVVLRYVPRREAASVPVGAAAVDRTTPPSSAPERPYRFPRPERATLANGLRVVASRVPKVPLVAATALVDAGSARDPAGREGLAALAAALLEEGTHRRGSEAIAEAVENLGAALSSNGEVDAAAVSLTALARNFPDAFAIAAEVLSEASFPERELERLRAEHLAQLAENRASPSAVADDVVEAALYGEHPYAHPLLGSEAALAAIGRHDVLEFAARHVRPESTVLIVAGDLDPAAVLALVERRLGGWDKGAAVPPPLPAPEPRGARRVLLVDRPGSAQSELRLANIGLPRAHADYVAAEVLNGILGGKFTSRLNLNLRETHGYTYGARSGFTGRKVAGPFVVSTAVATDVTAAALGEIFAELGRIRDEPVADKELDETRSWLQGVFPLTVETAAEVAGRLAEIELHGLGDRYFDDYRDRIAAVSAEQVRRLARAHVRPDEMVVVVVGDAARVAAGLERFGPVTRVDEQGRPV